MAQVISKGNTEAMLAAFEKAMGQKSVAHDNNSALFDAAKGEAAQSAIDGRSMSSIARKTGKPVEVLLHEPGSFVEVGNRTYEVMPNGEWRRLTLDEQALRARAEGTGER